MGWQFPLFKEAPRSFVAEIAQAHHWVQALPWDLIVERGQLVRELVFVVQGRILMQIFSPLGCDSRKSRSGEDEEDDAVQEEAFDAGAWFGEKCLFDRPHPYILWYCVHGIGVGGSPGG